MLQPFKAWKPPKDFETLCALRVPNIMKHVCVAARIGEGKAPGAGNSYSYCQDEQRSVAWRAEQVPSVVCLDATPQRDTRRTESTRFTRTFTVASPQAGPLLHAAVRRRFWLQPFGLARVLAHGVVESPLLRMTKPQAFRLALSENRDSASRVSLYYGL
jgi:hypothetical protein